MHPLYLPSPAEFEQIFEQVWRAVALGGVGGDLSNMDEQNPAIRGGGGGGRLRAGTTVVGRGGGLGSGFLCMLI